MRERKKERKRKRERERADNKISSNNCDGFVDKIDPIMIVDDDQRVSSSRDDGNSMMWVLTNSEYWFCIICLVKITNLFFLSFFHFLHCNQILYSILYISYYTHTHTHTHIKEEEKQPVIILRLSNVNKRRMTRTTTQSRGNKKT